MDNYNNKLILVKKGLILLQSYTLFEYGSVFNYIMNKKFQRNEKSS